MNTVLKKFSIAVFAILTASSVFAAEGDFAPPANFGNFDRNFGNREGGMRNREGGMRNREGGMRNRNGGMRNRNGGMRNRNMMLMMPLMSSASRIIAFETAREKFPAESAELDKAILATENQYAELAKKAGTELQPTLEVNLIKLRAADAAAYTEAIKAIKENPRTGVQKLADLAKKHNIELVPRRNISMREGRNVPAPSANRNISRVNTNKLRKEFPEEMKKYDELKAGNPEEAKKLLAELVKRSEAK